MVSSNIEPEKTRKINSISLKQVTVFMSLSYSNQICFFLLYSKQEELLTPILCLKQKNKPTSVSEDLNTILYTLFERPHNSKR